MKIVETRVIRRKAPIPIEPLLVGEKEEMLAELQRVRESTLAFIEETTERGLGKYRMSHAFLGTLNAYEWLQFIASHEIRYTKQVLPKTVTSLEK